MIFEEGKEYFLVTISGENDKIFANLHDAKKYIHKYRQNDYNGYYDTYLDYPNINIYKIEITNKLQ